MAVNLCYLRFWTLARAEKCGQHIYRVELDLIHDVERQGKNILQITEEMRATGDILDCDLDTGAMGTLDDPPRTNLPVSIVFATVIEPDIICHLFGIGDEKIQTLFVPRSGMAPAESAPDSPQASPPEPEPAASPASAPAESAAAPARKAKAAPPKQEQGQTAASEGTLRVNVNLLEALMNLAGELVLSRNQLRESMEQDDARALATSVQRINLVTSEIQDAIMQTRMQPIGNVLSKFPRVVRDIAQETGKEIRLDIFGKDVGLDKSMIESLSDPLTHMVRNAADHGVEAPGERARQGKAREGVIRIEARHEAGLVVIEIADDGKGIDPARLADKALSKGQITREKLQGMSDKDKLALVFLPGLSTAEKVTEVSGRGVGMDVVKTNLDRIGGKVEIDSEVGKGTVFRIKLPLTLAIIPSLIIRAGGERYAIPQISVVELLRIPPGQLKERIEIVGDSEVLLLRDQIIPIVRFADVIGAMRSYTDPETGRPEIDRRSRLSDRRSPKNPLDGLAAGEDEDVSERRGADRRYHKESSLEIAVLTTGAMHYGLAVDSFLNSEEIVVKPLGRHLKALKEYAGATIMGDGRVALILDVTGLAEKADLSPLSGTARAEEQAREAERDRLQDTHSLMLFHNGPDELCATPLDTVQRIERITGAQVENKGGRRTMQYRGASLPLVTLSDAAQMGTIDETRDLAVIVSSVHGREVGLLGAMPVDVVETQAAIDQSTHRQQGVAGSLILNDRTVILADVYELVEKTYPEWQTGAKPVLAAGKDAPTVLLAEDSDFFRSQVKKFIEDAGYTVLDAPDGLAAWELLEKNAGKVKAVVTDIEMPRLSGIGLTQRIRGDARFSGLPVIAVTSLAGAEEVATGKAAGIDDYQVKLDRDNLLDGLRRVLAEPAGSAV
jgi:two-component system, chemotaxis family, sensor kinase CheA